MREYSSGCGEKLILINDDPLQVNFRSVHAACEELLEVDIDHKEAKTLLHKNKMKKPDTERNQR